MKRKATSWVIMAISAIATASGQGAVFTQGNLAISRVGDGSALVNSGGIISVLEYSPAGVLVQTIGVPSGTGGLQVSGTATSEAALTLSTDGTQLALAGYRPDFTGTGSLSARSDVQAPRGYVTIGSSGVVSSTTAVGTISGNNIRSAVVTGNGVYLAGGTSGTVLAGSPNLTIQSSITNTRVIQSYNGNLYFSTASGTNGIYGFSGIPTIASTPSLIIGVTSPYDFVFNESGDRAYVTTTNNVLRYDFSSISGTWNLTNTSTTLTGVTGLEVSFGTSGNPDTVYAVNPGSFISMTNDGTAFSSQTLLASAGTNFAFRGLSFTPVPEPSAALLGGLGLLALLRRRR